MFSSLLKAVVNVVTLPVAVVADMATLGGTLTDRRESYTSAVLSETISNVNKATK